MGSTPRIKSPNNSCIKLGDLGTASNNECTGADLIIIGVEFIEDISFVEMLQENADAFLQYGIAIASNKRGRILRRPLMLH